MAQGVTMVSSIARAARDDIVATIAYHKIGSVGVPIMHPARRYKVEHVFLRLIT
jgi:hypothetical protein